MEAVAEIANDTGHAILADAAENPDFGFLPTSLTQQCRSLIESYHELHGYACLPNILWKSRLGPFIETHQELRQLLRKASTTRSAKKSNEGFARIATTILSLEILASSFAGWSAIYPQAGSRAQLILRRNSRSPQITISFARTSRQYQGSRLIQSDSQCFRSVLKKKCVDIKFEMTPSG